jgi:Cu+-exporting ATPase
MGRISGSLDEGRITFAPREAEARDPVCGMTVNPGRAAAVATYKGRSYFFCSDECKERFDADPEAFVPDEPGREREPESPQR